MLWMSDGVRIPHSRNSPFSVPERGVNKQAMAKSSEAPSEQTFETAIGRLEVLVEEMEREDLPLERLIVNYEEGIKLVKTCQQKLADAEKRIEIIQRQAGGEATLRPFDAEAESDATSPAGKSSPRDAQLF